MRKMECLYIHLRREYNSLMGISYYLFCWVCLYYEANLSFKVQKKPSLYVKALLLLFFLLI